MKHTSTYFSSFPKNSCERVDYSVFDEELAIFFRKEKLLQPSVTSLKNILAYSEKTAKKPNLLLC